MRGSRFDQNKTAAWGGGGEEGGRRIGETEKGTVG